MHACEDEPPDWIVGPPRGGPRWAWGGVAALVLLAPGMGQAQERLVQVRVVQVAGRSLYFDKGRADGLVPDVRVRLLPTGGAPFEVRIRAASTNSARAEAPPGVPLPPSGTRGEARVAARQREEPREAGERTVPEHPPWSTDDAGFTQDKPLLVRARGRTRAERPTRWRGREVLHYQYLEDRGGDRRSAYQFGRIGTELGASNPIGLGGELYLDVEYDRRGTDLTGGGLRTDDRVRVDRLSYAWGLGRDEPCRVQVGRFLSPSLPELGLIDGVEASLRVGRRARVGLGLGGAPEPLPARGTGDDLGVHLYVELPPDTGETLAGALAVQKTWHRGRDDRDQFLGRLEWTPEKDLRVWSSFRIDLYDSSDDVKGSGPELTEFWVQGQWTPGEGSGLALSASRYRWAELRRDEVLGVPPDLVRDGRVDRLDLSAWCPAGGGARLRVRGDVWEDQDRNGNSAELGLDVPECFGASGFLYLAAHYADAAYATGPTFRGRYARRIGGVFASLAYEAGLLRARGAGGISADATRHVLRGEIDFSPGERWDASLGIERSFGDLDDSFGVDLFMQYRF